MTSSNKANVRVMENELRHWWTLSQYGWSLIRQDLQHPLSPELRDEVETLADMTDWPRLREACRRSLTITAQMRETPAAAVA